MGLSGWDNFSVEADGADEVERMLINAGMNCAFGWESGCCGKERHVEFMQQALGGAKSVL